MKYGTVEPEWMSVWISVSMPKNQIENISILVGCCCRYRRRCCRIFSLFLSLSSCIGLAWFGFVKTCKWLIIGSSRVCIERLLIALLNYHNRRCVCVGRLFISFHLHVFSGSLAVAVSLSLLALLQFCENRYSLLHLFCYLVCSFARNVMVHCSHYLCIQTFVLCLIHIDQLLFLLKMSVFRWVSMSICAQQQMHQHTIMHLKQSDNRKQF